MANRQRPTRTLKTPALGEGLAEGSMAVPDRRTIFIVEDDDNVAGLRLNLLGRFGYRASRATD